MSVVVTGAYGFIGSNIIKSLNSIGVDDIIAVDDLRNGLKFHNLVHAKISAYYDRDDFLSKFDNWSRVDAIFHEGAESSTSQTSGIIAMTYNYQYSRDLLDRAIRYKIPFLYASSASVYGTTATDFNEDAELNPCNLYAYTKTLFDEYATKHIENGIGGIQGYRYFNVYGPGEDHKGDMMSPISKFSMQAKNNGVIKVFEGSENFKRDFVCVYDLVDAKIGMWLEQKDKSGIFNIGTGNNISFMDVANLCSNRYNVDIEIIPFPDHLKGHYQEYTCADITKLTGVMPAVSFISVEEYFRGL